MIVYSAHIRSYTASRIVDLATPWLFIQSLRVAVSVAVAFAAGSAGMSSYPLMIPYTCFCSRCRAIAVAHCAWFVPLNLVMVIVVEHILHDRILQLSVIVVYWTVRETSSSCHQMHCRMWGKCLAGGDNSLWQYWPPLNKRSGSGDHQLGLTPKGS